MNKIFFTIGFKIEASPYHSGFKPRCLLSALLVCGPLRDCLAAALAGNLAFEQPRIVISPIPSGYLGTACVVDLTPALLTTHNLLQRYLPAQSYEIAWHHILDGKWRHFAGANFGAFENHIEENAQWSAQMRSLFPQAKALPPPPIYADPPHP